MILSSLRCDAIDLFIYTCLKIFNEIERLFWYISVDSLKRKLSAYIQHASFQFIYHLIELLITICNSFWGHFRVLLLITNLILSRPIGDGVIASASEVNALKDSFSALDVSAVADIKTEDTVKQTPAVGITDCKCGMPLCICQVTAEPTTSIPSQERNIYWPSNAFWANDNPLYFLLIPAGKYYSKSNRKHKSKTKEGK